MTITLPRQSKPAFDFKQARIAFSRAVEMVMPLVDNKPMPAVYAEPEEQDVPRPEKNPYLTYKFTTPAAKSGDDTKYAVKDSHGNPTSIVGSGGVRRLTVDFDIYADSHEDAYSLMGTWQTALDLADTQAYLRQFGIAVWLIGGVADLSQLLNTGYEGRAHLTCQFGIAMNLQSDLGEMDSVEVKGGVTTDQGEHVNLDQTVDGG